MKFILKILVAMIFVPVAAIVVAAVGAAILALPRTTGSMTMQGLAAPVSIGRDHRGVPWINAENAADAYFALGFAHAQDRLFQMELMRRSGQGRLAEIVGASAIPADKLMRTLGVYRAAERVLERIEPETAEVLTAYARGVNAFIESGAVLPIEFTLLWFKPEPWREADSLVWQKLMGLQLSGNWNEELLRAEVIKAVGVDRAAQLFPAEIAGSPTTLASALPAHSHRLLATMTDIIRPMLASNIWALAPARTATGGAILANDPHLGFGAPNIWYLAAITYPGVDLVGATMPGVPFHLLGHNGQLAWGFTTTHGDTQDLFVETELDEETYQAPGGPLTFEIRTEQIQVRFGDPVTISVRKSRHGPIVSDVMERDSNATGGGKALALATPLLLEDDATIDGIFRMARAQTTREFLDAAALFHAPQQNVMFADRAGAIGYMAAGRVPIRADRTCDGLTPSDGADGRCDWIGWISPPELPQSLDPADGVLINANNRIAGPDYPYLLAAEWPEPYRAQRITDTIADRAGITLTETMSLQMDEISLLARDLLPGMLERLDTTAPEPQLIELLRRWDGDTARERVEPLLFTAWHSFLKSRLIEDDLGSLYPDFFGDRATLIKSILSDQPHWCDNVTTADAETCASQVYAAWQDTLSWLNENAGADRAAWRWDRFHVASFRHPLFGFVPVLDRLTGFFIETGGDNSTVNRGSPSRPQSRAPFVHRHGPGYRAVYDLADLGRSRFTMAGGQSGQLLSGHFRDLLEGWRDGTYFELRPPGIDDPDTDWLQLHPSN